MIDKYVDLPDGRKLGYSIKHSAKAKNMRLKMSAREGLTVIVPDGIDETHVVKLVNSKSDWIASKLDQHDQVRHFFEDKKQFKPETFILPALAESWVVEYKATSSKTVGAKTDSYGRVLVYGAVDNAELCCAALRRWLLRHAKATLIPCLDALAKEINQNYSQAMIKNQRTRWGSRSATGVISLNAKLLFLLPELVRYVMMHELCHVLEHNHSIRFWAYLRQIEPQTDVLHSRLQESWKQIPAWANKQPSKGIV